MARAFGYTSSQSEDYRPSSSWLTSTYFEFHNGTGFHEGDIIMWGPFGTTWTDLNGSTGHAAYVSQIGVYNNGDGNAQLSVVGLYRDEDPHATGDWDCIYLDQVNGEDGSVQLGVTLSEVDGWRRSHYDDVMIGYVRLRPEYKCKMTFSNSFDSGLISFGKFDSGSSGNHNSGDYDFFPTNAQIPARAEQSINTNVFSRWRKESDQFLYPINQRDITVVVGTINDTYTAVFGGGGSSCPPVTFENRSDNVPIKSIIKVSDSTKFSPTQPYCLGVSATAYQSLLIDRVYYTFSQWSTGSTNPTITPTSSGNYIANYSFGYVSPPDEIYPFANPVGQPIKITWRKATSPYIDQIQIWRSVAHFETANVIATLSATATEYTDYDYIRTSGYTDKVVNYDVRFRYHTSARTVYSDPNWFSIYGSGPQAEKAPSPKAILSEATPKDFGLSSYPNPFNPSTKISYYLASNSYVEINIFNMAGQVVRKLSEDQQEGNHILTWDAKDYGGQRLPSGIYFLRISVHPHDGSYPFNGAQKLVLTK